MTNIQHLYTALGKQGISKQKVARILPEWWSTEVEQSPSAAQQAKLYIARALSLRIRPFCETPPRVEFDLPSEKKFKRSAKTTENDVELAVALALSASRIALSGIEPSSVAPPPSASAIRNYILSQGNNWVGLDQLLDYCWRCGIPVIHLATDLLGKKMDGIAMSINGRPSIVLSNKRASGFLLFHLAHELGHIALGHLASNGAIVDDEIKKFDNDAGRDQQEIEADRFAVELLTGNADLRLNLLAMPIAPKLAELAVVYGRQNNIDPTHVVLNCAHNKPQLFPLCVKAANLLGGNESDQALIGRKLFEELSDRLNSEGEHLLRKLIA